MDREAVFNNLKWSLQAMACDSKTQVSLFPEFIVASDEMINDFNHWKGIAESRYQSEFSPMQRESLDQITSVIEAITQSEEEIWENDSLTTQELWGELRILAASALEEFHWQLEVPSTSRSIFL